MKIKVLITLMAACFIASCVYHKDELPVPVVPNNNTPVKSIDEVMHGFALQSGMTYFKNGDTLTGTGAHTPFVRIRFNAKAQSALGADGELPANGIMPDSAVVVKELYNSKGGPVIQYVVMFKNPTNTFAAQGWVWGEYKPDGTKVYSAQNQGQTCLNCHGAGRDHIQAFDVY